jgi:oligoribonuclease NrnB/cAMP/cGMP phosphodiesterase (DHH superfamily)
MKNIRYDYIIYHKNCFDGFTGFVLFMNTKYHTRDIIIMPDVPSAKEPPVDIEGKNVIIIDVAYKPEIIKYISNKSKSMLYIDHHITHYEEIMKLNLKDTDKIVYDEKKSGASLVWKTFYDKPKPLLVRYIEDNDTGTWKLKHTIHFINGLETHYTTEPSYENIRKWYKLLNKTEVIKMIKKGKIYDEYKTYLLKSNSKRFTIEGFPSKKILKDFPNFFKKEGQYKVAVYNGSGCPNNSLLGKRLVDKVNCDFAFLWSYHLDRKEYVVSLRSNKVDVSEIAKIFGGGGHVLASAFSFNHNKYDINDLFMSESFPRSYK